MIYSIIFKLRRISLSIGSGKAAKDTKIGVLLVEFKNHHSELTMHFYDRNWHNFRITITSTPEIRNAFPSLILQFFYIVFYIRRRYTLLFNIDNF
uniref:Uncharacterized protein n=1 Tax=Romanomermis culicivorax TaxID=13658 RepID=A0A915KDI6_ROMCU